MFYFAVWGYVAWLFHESKKECISVPGMKPWDSLSSRRRVGSSVWSHACVLHCTDPGISMNLKVARRSQGRPTKGKGIHGTSPGRAVRKSPPGGPGAGSEKNRFLQASSSVFVCEYGDCDHQPACISRASLVFLADPGLGSGLGRAWVPGFGHRSARAARGAPTEALFQGGKRLFLLNRGWRKGLKGEAG